MKFNGQSFFEVALGTGLMSVCVYIARYDIKILKEKYSHEGKFNWYFFIISLILRFCVSFGSVWITFHIFDINDLKNFMQFKVIASISIGIISYDLLPFLVEQGIDFVKKYVKSIKNEKLDEVIKEDKKDKKDDGKTK